MLCLVFVQEKNPNLMMAIHKKDSDLIFRPLPPRWGCCSARLHQTFKTQDGSVKSLILGVYLLSISQVYTDVLTAVCIPNTALVDFIQSQQMMMFVLVISMHRMLCLSRWCRLTLINVSQLRFQTQAHSKFHLY